MYTERRIPIECLDFSRASQDLTDSGKMLGRALQLAPSLYGLIN